MAQFASVPAQMSTHTDSLVARAQEFLAQMGMDRGVRLSRLEWAAVRGALGRPRRLSQSFLRQERVRLEAHRAAVRAKYEEVGAAVLFGCSCALLILSVKLQ